MNTSISQDDVATILGCVKLERLLGPEDRIPGLYSGLSIESLIRAHILPYLIPITSERHLADELSERSALQEATGLKHVPERATLWHFRKRNAITFPKLLRRALALIAVEWSAKRLLHFSFDANINGAWRTDHCLLHDSFTDPLSENTFHLYSQDARLSSSDSELQQLWLPNAVQPKPDHRGRQALTESIGFPIWVYLGDCKKAHCLNPPAWLQNLRYSRENLGVYLGKAGIQPYRACNVVVRHKKDKDKILLAERLLGSGRNHFALPGGKQKAGESAFDCAKRELREETSLEMRDAHLISYVITNHPGYPRVESLGIEATSWTGTPTRNEPRNHGEWDWYSLDELPQPLFFPTERVISDLISGEVDVTLEEIDKGHYPQLPLL